MRSTILCIALAGIATGWIPVIWVGLDFILTDFRHHIQPDSGTTSFPFYSAGYTLLGIGTAWGCLAFFSVALAAYQAWANAMPAGTVSHHRQTSQGPVAISEHQAIRVA